MRPLITSYQPPRRHLAGNNLLLITEASTERLYPDLLTTSVTRTRDQPSSQSKSTPPRGNSLSSQPLAISEKRSPHADGDLLHRALTIYDPCKSGPLHRQEGPLLYALVSELLEYYQLTALAELLAVPLIELSAWYRTHGRLCPVINISLIDWWNNICVPPRNQTRKQGKIRQKYDSALAKARKKRKKTKHGCFPF